jgi:hypothetical protein
MAFHRMVDDTCLACGVTLDDDIPGLHRGVIFDDMTPTCPGASRAPRHTHHFVGAPRGWAECARCGLVVTGHENPHDVSWWECVEV